MGGGSLSNLKVHLSLKRTMRKALKKEGLAESFHSQCAVGGGFGVAERERENTEVERKASKPFVATDRLRRKSPVQGL